MARPEKTPPPIRFDIQELIEYYTDCPWDAMELGWLFRARFLKGRKIGNKTLIDKASYELLFSVWTQHLKNQ